MVHAGEEEAAARDRQGLNPGHHQHPARRLRGWLGVQKTASSEEGRGGRACWRSVGEEQGRNRREEEAEEGEGGYRWG